MKATFSPPTTLPGIKVDVYENLLLEKNYVMVLKEQRAIIVGDYYTFALKTLPFNEALDFSFTIAKQRVDKHIEQKTLRQAAVSGQVCRNFFPDGGSTAGNICKWCGKQSWQH